MSDASSSPFQAIVFDLGGVIVAHDNKVMFDRLASRCRSPVQPEKLKTLLSNPALTTGAAPVSTLHRQLQGELGYDTDWETFAADWCCHFTLDPSMVAFVQRLSENNRVMLFSNTNQEHWEFVDGLAEGALSRMEAYLSHQIGEGKPSVRSFQVVAKLAGIDPARSIFFDDVAANVEGARRAGFQAEVFVDEATLAGFLSEHGVMLG